MSDDSKALEIFREEKGAKARKAVNLKRPQMSCFSSYLSMRQAFLRDPDEQ